MASTSKALFLDISACFLVVDRAGVIDSVSFATMEAQHKDQISEKVKRMMDVETKTFKSPHCAWATLSFAV